MELDLVALEADPRAGHVEAPHPGGALADLGDARVPVVDEVLAPAGQRLGVVDAEVLLVLHLEAGVLDLGDDLAGADQLAVGEDVAVDERPVSLRAGCRPGDAVVEQPALRAQLVARGSRSTPGSSSRRCARSARSSEIASKPVSVDVAVVQVADLGEVVEPLLLDLLLRPRRLLARQRDAERRARRTRGPRGGPCRPSRSRRRAAAGPAGGRACGRPGRTSRPAPPRASRPRSGRPRRCRSSTGRGPSRRTCWRRRSGGGSPRRRGSSECRSPSTMRRQRGSVSCGGGAGGTQVGDAERRSTIVTSLGRATAGGSAACSASSLSTS